MSTQLQALLQSGFLKSTTFSTSSRYYYTTTAKKETSEGKTIIYLLRRFIPPPEQYSLLQEHNIVEGDRIDNLASQYYGDPEQSWQLCDANSVMHPCELTETIGKKIKITLPEGIPG